MTQVKGPIKKDPDVRSDGQSQPGRDFPPLKENLDSSKERWDLIRTEMERHQEILAELADS
jgi:hypothetical protein